ncbi:hypothetical protein K501DRAFT_278153 [Backusella circina FSU 941]|nr:hypothetical protein K501DRAFT_278153 [Backusella circina FSU 941]
MRFLKEKRTYFISRRAPRLYRQTGGFRSLFLLFYVINYFLQEFLIPMFLLSKAGEGSCIMSKTELTRQTLIIYSLLLDFACFADIVGMRSCIGRSDILVGKGACCDVNTWLENLVNFLFTANEPLKNPLKHYIMTTDSIINLI